MTEPSTESLFRPALITLGGIALSCILGVGFWFLSHRMEVADAAPWMRWASVVLYMAVIWGVIFATIQLARRASGVRKLTGAAKRYNRRFMIAMGLYTVTLFVALLIWTTARPTALPLVLLLALAPAVPLVVVIGLIGVYLRDEEDEFLRAVMNESALMASGGVFAVATVWGFLEMFSIAPHAPSWMAFPLWCLMFAFTQPIVRMRYR